MALGSQSGAYQLPIGFLAIGFEVACMWLGVALPGLTCTAIIRTRLQRAKAVKQPT